MTALLAIAILRRVPYGPVTLGAAEFDELRALLADRVMASDDDYMVVKLTEYMDITVRRQG